MTFDLVASVVDFKIWTSNRQHGTAGYYQSRKALVFSVYLFRTGLICLGVSNGGVPHICSTIDIDRYNIGIMAIIYQHPGFKKTLHNPKAPTTGLITAIYYLGTWLSYIFLSHPASDRLWRRYAALTVMAVTCIGSVLQASASGPSPLAMMVTGRIICGLGLAIVSTAVPLYQR